MHDAVLDGSSVGLREVVTRKLWNKFLDLSIRPRGEVMPWIIR
jgi:hypothetical protein